MSRKTEIAQLFLRLSIGLGFIFPVLDRVGILGAAGENGNAWDNWENFIAYTSTLVPYTSEPLTNLLAIAATLAEIVFGVLLIAGYKTKLAAVGSFALTLVFALSMLFFSGYRAPFTYSVFTCSAASLLLARVENFQWSIDELLTRDN